MGKDYTIRAKAFGMHVQFYDPYCPQGEDKSMGVKQCETLDELLRTSDVVNLPRNCAHMYRTRPQKLFLGAKKSSRS
jgi:C-terminal binding protein